jgi:DNA transposition AAA+ family ATPase
MTTVAFNHASITKAIRNAFIRIPRVEQIMRRIEELHAYQCDAEEPENLVLIGEPGVGKSTLLRRYVETHARIVHEEFTEISVLYVAVPAACSIKKLAGEMLLAMGSPFWNRGGEPERTHQLLTLLVACKVRLIVLDEVNHLVERGSSKTHYAVGDWIKQIGEKSGVSFVLAGTPTAEQLLITNEQLRGRFSEGMHLAPLGLSSDQDAKVFRGVLRTFQKLFADIDCIDLASTSVSRQMAYATGGRLRALRRLLVRAVELGAKQNGPCIDMPVLAEAFHSAIYRRAPRERNPFLEGFDGQPLTKPGEPYGPERK